MKIFDKVFRIPPPSGRADAGANMGALKGYARRLQYVAASVLACTAIWMASAEVNSLSEAEAKRIEDYLLPMPKQINLSKTVVVRRENLALRLESRGVTEQTALAQLEGQLAKYTNSTVNGDKFEIVIGALDQQRQLAGRAITNAARLAALPNKEQAYLIQPDGDTCLIVAGLTARGVYYGVMTLMQLIESGSGANGVTIPLATVTDWPDFADRGFWHMRVGAIPKLSQLKLNHIESSSHFEVSPDRKMHVVKTSAITAREKKGTVWTLDSACAEAKKYAFVFVPGITHFDLWAESPELLAGRGDRQRLARGYGPGKNPGFTQAFPELLGQGDRARRSDRYQGLCFSQAGLVDVLVDLMTQVAARGTEEITMWASEYPGIQCECPPCLAAGQLQLEVKTTLQAWRKVREQYPGLRLKIFYGRGGGPMKGEDLRLYPEKAMREIIAMLPKEVALCAGGGTGNTLPVYAVQGGLANQWHVGPGLQYWDFFNCEAREKISGHLDNRYYALTQGMMGFGYDYSDDMREIGLQISLYAEYAWNTHGRDLRDFFRAWALRRGIAEPEKFAEFAGIMASIKGAGMPLAGFLRSQGGWLLNIPGAIANRRKADVLPDFNADTNGAIIQQYAQAARLAQDLEPQEFYHLARANLCYHQLEAGLRHFVDAAVDGPADEAAWPAIDKALSDFLAACALRIAALEKSNPRFFKQQSGVLSQIRKHYETMKGEVRRSAANPGLPKAE